MPYCKACGYELSNPADDLHDPDNLLGEVEGGINNEDAHISVNDGPNGPRMFCGDTGQITKIVPEQPTEEGEGGGEQSQNEPSPNQGEPQQSQPEQTAQPQQPKQAQPQNAEVYDLPESKSAEDVLTEVITSPFIDLSEPQMAEVKDWAEDYDGHIPADVLEDVLGNMSGVQKQTAKLARQKYEVKLSRWVQSQQDGDSGPPIGVSRHPTGSPGQRGRTNPRQRRQVRQGGRGGEAQTAEKPTEKEEAEKRKRRGREDTPQDIREQRRRKRVERRSRALDQAAQEFADKAAGQMAEEMGGFVGDARDILYKVFMRKAEKDPDWFFEKAEKWDIDIMDVLLEPSEARKSEMVEDNSSNGDVSGAEDALEQVMADGPSAEEPTESNNTPQPEVEDGGLFDDELEEEAREGQPEEAPEEEGEDPFQEHFGGMEAE